MANKTNPDIRAQQLLSKYGDKKTALAQAQQIAYMSFNIVYWEKVLTELEKL